MSTILHCWILFSAGGQVGRARVATIITSLLYLLTRRVGVDGKRTLSSDIGASRGRNNQC